MCEDKPDNTYPSDENRDSLQPGGGMLKPDQEKIPSIDMSLEAIRERIDQAYNHICMDLPEINLEIYRTFQQATDTLDSLSAHGSAGMIDKVVEEIENLLQGLLLRIKHLKNYDTRVLEVLRLTNMNPDPNSTAPLSVDSLDSGFRTRLAKFSSKRDELIEALKHSLELEETGIREISSLMSKDVQSLGYTLNSMVIILKDLISRSNSVKNPILKIMSGLQTHDIVNQDITTIARGLKTIQSLNEISEDRDAFTDALLFQEKMATLSRKLIAQLIEVVRNHGSELEQDIDRIEDMISRVKEDKDAIGDFLLMNTSGKSTFDIVIAEVSEMFSDLSSKVKIIGNTKESQQSLNNQLWAFCNDLEQYVTSSVSNLPAGTLDLILKMVSPLKSQARMIKFGSGSQDLMDHLSEFGRTSGITRTHLEEINDLLIGSIKGIDTYSGRCMDAITRFRQDIHKLMETLEGSDSILLDLEDFALSISSIRNSLSGQDEMDRSQVISEELGEILYRLENPHSNSLIITINDQDVDDGLTLF